MAVNLLFERYFELLNFVFLCVCIRWVYKKYGAPFITQAIQTKKKKQQAVQQQLLIAKQQSSALDQAIADQELRGAHLVQQLALWSKKIELRSHALQQEHCVLQKKLVAYNATQKNAVFMHDLQQELLPEVVAELRKQVTTEYQDIKKQQHMVQEACAVLAHGVI